MNEQTLGANGFDASANSAAGSEIRILGEMQLALIGGGIGTVTIG
jgi:hypothetical protein